MNRDYRSKRCVRRLNRRQRKKLHVAQYAEYVFEVRVWFEQPLQEADNDQFLDALVQMIESRNLRVTGMGALLPLKKADALIHAWGRRSPTADDQKAVMIWLGQRAEVARVEVGDLVDAWHGWEDPEER
jgi:uncharacterized protein YggL (DUF469 family)